MQVESQWVRRWVLAGMAACAVALWPLACSHDGSSRAADPAAEPARLDFTLKDLAGKDVRLSDYKGRPMIVNFWATWCLPCKAEIPGFVQLVDKYKDEQFTVLGVSTSDSPEDLQRFVAANRINYPILVGLGHDDLLEAYDAVDAVPVSWFIRRDGTVYMKKVGTDTQDWFDSQVKALFALP